MNPRRIAIVGGIGSGKSVVSRILRCMGYAVYDCDSRAKEIMDCDEDIHASLCRDIHPDAVTGGKIDRHLISEIVFSNPDALARLNSIVHGAVRADIDRWCIAQSTSNHQPVFIETAIPRQSGIYRDVDEIWEVTAPVEERVHRVELRSGLSREQILKRIESQKSEDLDGIPHKTIDNSPESAVLPQLNHLLSR